MWLLDKLAKFFNRAPVDTRHRWHLMLGQKLLGELIFCSYETPWITAEFVPTEEFFRYKPYIEWGNLDEDDESESSEISGELNALIGEVNLLGRLKVVEVKTKETWEPRIHFGGEYSYATFR